MSILPDVILAAGLFAGRPAFGSEGRLYYATDTAVLYRDTGIAWETYATGLGAHDLLSASHGDTDPQAVTRGSLIYGDATPDWNELVIGAAGRVLTVNAGGTEPEWAAPAGGGGAWALISETILVAPAASVNFAAIPGIYRSLVMHTQLRTDRGAAAENDSVGVRCNADAGANYDWFQHYMNTGAHIVQAFRGVNQIQAMDTETAVSRANNWSVGQFIMIGYALADREKWLITPIAESFGDVSADGDIVCRHLWGRWRNTAAVIALLLFPITGPNFVAGSRFTLYGIT